MAIRTHYDMLEVARTATPEVIAAAYRSLSKRHHPDRHGGDRDAEARMAELNAAYAVLTDETKRREHDRWIAGQERAARGYTARPRPAEERTSERPSRELLWWIAGGIAAGAAMLVALTVRVAAPARPAPDPAPVASAPLLPPAELPPLQPVPAPAPARPAGYLDAASTNDGGGRSRITLDNSGGTVAVEVALVPLQPYGARRRLYLPPGGFFVMDRVRGGRYRLRYKDLGDGTVSTGDAFQLGGGGEPGDLTFRLARE